MNEVMMSRLDPIMIRYISRIYRINKSLIPNL